MSDVKFCIVFVNHMDSEKEHLERFRRQIQFVKKQITPLNFRILSYFQRDFHVNLFLFNFTTPKLLFAVLQGNFQCFNPIFVLMCVNCI